MLNWLPLSDRKNIDIPRIVIEEPTGQNYGGYYDYINNIIVAVVNDNIASTIAHEFKHACQYQLNQNWGPIVEIPPNYPCYETMITNYFNSSLMEMEALVYQIKYSKDDISYWWLHHLVSPNK